MKKFMLLIIALLFLAAPAVANPIEIGLGWYSKTAVEAHFGYQAHKYITPVAYFADDSMHAGMKFHGLKLPDSPLEAYTNVLYGTEHLRFDFGLEGPVHKRGVYNFMFDIRYTYDSRHGIYLGTTIVIGK